MNAEPLDAHLVELQRQLEAYVALVKTGPDEDHLLDAAEVVRDASAALTEAIADRTGQLISLHYVFDEDDDSDGETDELVMPGVHITIEEVLRIVDEETLVRSAGSPGPHELGDSPAERAVYALLEGGTSLSEIVANAGRYGLEPVEGATGVSLIDVSAE